MMLAATFQTMSLYETLYALAGLGVFIVFMGLIAINIVRVMLHKSSQRKNEMQSEERINQMNMYWDVNWGG